MNDFMCFELHHRKAFGMYNFNRKNYSDAFYTALITNTFVQIMNCPKLKGFITPRMISCNRCLEVDKEDEKKGTPETVLTVTAENQ